MPRSLRQEVRGFVVSGASKAALDTLEQLNRSKIDVEATATRVERCCRRVGSWVALISLARCMAPYRRILLNPDRPSIRDRHRSSYDPSREQGETTEYIDYIDLMSAVYEAVGMDFAKL